MIRRTIFLALTLAAAGLPAVEAAELVVLVPLMAGDQPVMRAGPKGEPQAPIFKRAPATDPLTKAIAVESSRGAIKFMLALDEHAQKLAGSATPGPTYLLKSEEEGGFARRGFWLSTTTKAANNIANNIEWHAEPYVNLVVDKQTLEDGTFEEIFAHEMGHVFLRRLIPKLPNGLSRTPHSSLAVTDYPTAFDEGFAIHFQGVARFLTKNPNLDAIDKGLELKPFLSFWQSNVDRSLRLRGVRDNLFVHKQLSAPLRIGDATSLFDLTHLKNGQQMLSSEGVIATLFYHLQLQTGDTATTLAERYKSLLTSLRIINDQRLVSSTPVFLNLMQAHIQRVPADKDRWVGTFLNVTYGATAGTTVTRDLTKLSALGQEGNEEFIAALKQSRAALATLTGQISRNPQRLGAAVGPELWLAVKRGDETTTINLNTAERTTLINVLDFEPLDADLLLADRDAKGPFLDVADFAKRRNVSPFIRKRFGESAKLAVSLGGYQRP